MKSTSSGINATLFGTSRLVHHEIATEGAIPRLFSFRNREGIPVHALLLMVLTAAFAALGTLKQITEFGSVAFLIADAVANFVNLQLADETGSNRLFPALGPAWYGNRDSDRPLSPLSD